MIDYALVNLLVTGGILVATFAFRKRILKALGRLLLRGAIEFAQGTFLVEEVSKDESGAEVRKIGLSAQGRAIVAALTPVLIAEAVKNVKIKLPTGGPGLPQGLDLSNLSEALPAILGSGLIPKKYAGILALAAPFLQNFAGKGSTSNATASATSSGGGWK